MKSLEEQTLDVLRDFKKNEQMFRNLIDDLNERVLPKMVGVGVKVNRMDNYALGKISVLTMAIKEPMDHFREEIQPQLKNNWSDVNDDYLSMICGQVDTLSELLEELEENIDFLG